MGLVCPEKGWKTVVWEGRDVGGASLRWEVFASHPELGGHHFPDGNQGAGDAYTEVILVLVIPSKLGHPPHTQCSRLSQVRPRGKQRCS